MSRTGWNQPNEPFRISRPTPIRSSPRRCIRCLCVIDLQYVDFLCGACWPPELWADRELRRKFGLRPLEVAA